MTNDEWAGARDGSEFVRSMDGHRRRKRHKTGPLLLCLLCFLWLFSGGLGSAVEGSGGRELQARVGFVGDDGEGFAEAAFH